MPMNSKTMRTRTFHPEATAWRKAVIANSGTVSAITMRAVSNFCTAINAAGIRSKFLRLNLVCGNDLAAARVPLYRGASATGTQYGSAADTNIGPFTSADYSEATGLQGNGSNKALDTTITVGTLVTFGLSFNNLHMSVYNRSLSDESRCSFGVYDLYFVGNGATAAINTTSVSQYDGTCFPEFASGGQDANSYSYMLLTRNACGSTIDTRGFNLGEFAVASNSFYGLNGTEVPSGGGDGGAVDFSSPDVAPLYFLSDTYNYSSQLLSAYSCGLPMTTTANRLAFATAMTAFQKALRRNYP